MSIMPKWECYRCGCICDEDELEWDEWSEWRPYGETGCYERMAEPYCPECGSKRVDQYFGHDDDDEEDEDDGTDQSA